MPVDAAWVDEEQIAFQSERAELAASRDKREGVLKERRKREIERDKRYKMRGLRGEFKKIQGSHRHEELVTVARKQRIKAGTEGGSKAKQAFLREEGFVKKKPRLPWESQKKERKRNTGVPEVKPPNLKNLVARYKRTGELPGISVEVVKELDTTGVDGNVLRRMIQAMLVKSGLEINPGPNTDVEDMGFVDVCSQLGVVVEAKSFKHHGKKIDPVCSTCHSVLVSMNESRTKWVHVQTNFQRVQSSAPEKGRLSIIRPRQVSASAPPLESPSNPPSRTDPPPPGSNQPSTSGSIKVEEYPQPVVILAGTIKPVTTVQASNTVVQPLAGVATTRPSAPPLPTQTPPRPPLTSQPPPTAPPLQPRSLPVTTPLPPRNPNIVPEVPRIQVLGPNVPAVTLPEHVLDGHRPTRRVLHDLGTRLFGQFTDLRDVNVGGVLPYVGERRLATCRKVDEIKSGMVVMRVSYSQSNVLVRWLVTVLPFLSYSIVGAILGSCIPLDIALVFLICAMTLHAVMVYLVFSFKGPVDKSVYYIPHLVSAVLAEYEYGVSATVMRTTIMSKIRRLACLPTPDCDALLYFKGTCEIIMQLAESDDFFERQAKCGWPKLSI